LFGGNKDSASKISFGSSSTSSPFASSSAFSFSGSQASPAQSKSVFGQSPSTTNKSPMSKPAGPRSMLENLLAAPSGQFLPNF
jgi:hypothetical protein